MENPSSFFSFDGGTSPPTFSCGLYRTHDGLALAEYEKTSGIDYMHSLRPVCEVVFYFLLQVLVYNAGVRAKCLGKSIPGCQWTEADKFANLALSHAMNATKMASNLDCAADGETEFTLNCLRKRFAKFGLLVYECRSIDFLKCSLEAVPPTHKKEHDLLSSWDEEQLKFC